ncbi:hypothetical protein X798_00349 [Onchocerca flexuosa]|uniref:Uncharacterized protein n=1 Tax=Onchocerca flexuosa TaxID=387005 RepID=A0A238C5J1_9BILA|nr:hypothetical protein X798_00349 [Onchocerca flexuosa]
MIKSSSPADTDTFFILQTTSAPNCKIWKENETNQVFNNSATPSSTRANTEKNIVSAKIAIRAGMTR